ncbi:uncharacterized protein LOC130679255 [Manis pentadactyla]|uniref:uncharacterized protein LOC130679255 n=1 Tax=Manis pentadactyla TaxID=143292 RepID=UPI00255CCFCA|nr:uncharacterized protein LOC130679255 [Manis pentadactyla]
MRTGQQFGDNLEPMNMSETNSIARRQGPRGGEEERLATRPGAAVRAQRAKGPAPSWPRRGGPGHSRPQAVPLPERFPAPFALKCFPKVRAGERSCRRSRRGRRRRVGSPTRVRAGCPRPAPSQHPGRRKIGNFILTRPSLWCLRDFGPNKVLLPFHGAGSDCWLPSAHEQCPSHSRRAHTRLLAWQVLLSLICISSETKPTLSILWRTCLGHSQERKRDKPVLEYFLFVLVQLSAHSACIRIAILTTPYAAYTSGHAQRAC